MTGGDVEGHMNRVRDGNPPPAINRHKKRLSKAGNSRGSGDVPNLRVDGVPGTSLSREPVSSPALQVQNTITRRYKNRSIFKEE